MFSDILDVLGRFVVFPEVFGVSYPGLCLCVLGGFVMLSNVPKCFFSQKFWDVLGCPLRSKMLWNVVG